MKQKHHLNSGAATPISVGGGDADADDETATTTALSKSSHRKRNFSAVEEDERRLSGSSKMSHCSRFQLILWTLMGFLLVAAVAVLVTLWLSPSLLNREERCPDLDSPFQQKSYKLFSTKTSYMTTYNYLAKPAQLISLDQHLTIDSNNDSLSPSFTFHKTNNRQQVDKKSLHLPKFFSDSETIESIHSHMTSKLCAVRHVSYVGRHASRLPKHDELNKINELITLQVQEYLKQVDKSSNAERLSAGANQPSLGRQAPGVGIVPTNKSSGVCLDPLMQFRKWTPFAQPQQGNQITEHGGLETEHIAQRLKAIYPGFFDCAKTKCHMGTTKELRTAQTAVAFARLLTNFAQLEKVCQLRDFPRESTASPEKADEISNNRCFNNFLREFAEEGPAFHDTCDQFAEKTLYYPLDFIIKSQNHTEFIRASVSKYFKVSLNNDEMKAIYDACRYESAIRGTSIWCNAFQEQDLRFLEYINDVDDYFNNAYGAFYMAQSACSLTRNILKSIYSILTTPNATNTANYYFTHSQVIQRVFASLINLKRDPAYEAEAVKAHLNRGTVPKVREWQTSLISPFSANLIFTVYECPKGTGRVLASRDESAEDSADLPDMPVLDVSLRNELKLVASLNEQPIKLDDCKGLVCEINEIINNSGLSKEAKPCNLREICREKTVYN